MKKFFLAGLIVFAIGACSKKLTPAKTTSTDSNATTTTLATRSADTKTVASAEIIAAGKTTYEAKCGRCHALHAADEYTAEKWVPLVDAMAPKSKLTDTEKTNVRAYVQTGAKP